MSADSSIRAAVAAVLAKVDEALLPLRKVLTAAGQEAEGLAAYVMQLYQQQTLAEIRAQAYKTNDLVEISDDFTHALHEPKTMVNGSSIKLDVRELLLVFVLARQTRNLARKRNLSGIPEPGFLNVASLIREIDRLKAEVGMSELWRNAIDTDVHKAVSSVRSKLARAGLNRNLIEGKRKIGYRLSTPHWNLLSPSPGAS